MIDEFWVTYRAGNYFARGQAVNFDPPARLNQKHKVKDNRVLESLGASMVDKVSLPKLFESSLVDIVFVTRN